MSQSPIPFPDKTTVAGHIATLGANDEAFLMLVMENPAQDENLIEGLLAFLNEAATARILNSLKLDKAGFWFGEHAPSRLQVRIMETARSSQHAAHQAFRAGLIRSGGLDKAFPKG